MARTVVGRREYARRVLGALRVKPFRGDQVAAGVVVLTVLVVLVVLRFAELWSDAGLLAVAVVPAMFVLALAVLSPLQDGDGPRAYQTVLYVCAYALSATALVVFAAVVCDGLSADGSPAWIAAVLTIPAGFFAVARRSPTATFLAATSAGVALVAATAWIGGDDLQTVRWMLLVVILGDALGVLGQRDRRPLHAVQLANAGGLAALAVAAPDLLDVLFAGPTRTGWGWELVVLAAGFGLVSYGAVDHERGAAVLGVIDLAAFAFLAAFGDDDPTLLGWPLALALAAAIMLAVGLRPTTPAPPEPPLPDPPAPAVAFPPRGEPPIDED